MARRVVDGVIYEGDEQNGWEVVGYADAPAQQGGQQEIVLGRTAPRQPEGPPSGYRQTSDGNLSYIPGGPADPDVISRNGTAGRAPSNSMGMTAEARSAALNQYRSMANLARGVNELHDRFLNDLSSWNPMEGRVGALRPQDRVFDDASGGLSAYVAAALALSGQQFNTPAEQQLFIGSILPRSSDTDEQISQKLRRLDTMVSEGVRQGRSILGISPDNDLLSGNRDLAAFMQRTGQASSGQGSDAREGQTLAKSDDLRPLTSVRPRSIPEGVTVEGQLPNGDRFGSRADGSPWAEISGDLNAGDDEARDGNSVDAFMRGAADIGTAGFANKFAAAANTIAPLDALGGADVRSGWGDLNFADAYRHNLGIQTRTDDADSRVNGGAQLAGQVGGGLLGLANITRVAPSLASGGAFAPRALAADALYGGTLSGNLASDRGRAVLPEMAKGAALGAAGGAFGRGVLAPAVTRALDTRTGQAVANTIGRVARAPVNGVRGMMGQSPLPSLRLTPAVRPTPAQALLNSNVPASDLAPIMSRLDEASRLGVPFALADSTPALRRLAGAASRRAGDDVRNAADATLRSRATGQADRALGQIERNFGPISNPNAVEESLMNQARANAAPLYENAYSAPPIGSPTIDSILQTPSGRQALANANRIAADELRDPGAMGFRVDAQGNVVLSPRRVFNTDTGNEVADPIMQRVYSPQSLDYVKRGLDNAVEAARSGNFGSLDTAGRAVDGVRRQFISELDRLNPDYAAARAAWAGPVQAKEALEAGRQFTRTAPRDIVDQMTGMSPSQRDMFGLGARSSLADQVDRTRFSSNPWESIYGSPVAQQRVASVFPDGAKDFGRAYELEGDMARTATEILGGSPTAARMAADAQFGAGALGNIGEAVIDTAATGAPIRAIGRSISDFAQDRLALGLGQAAQKRADNLLPTLLNTDAAAARDALDEAVRRVTARNAYTARNRRIGGMFGYGALLPASNQASN